MSGTDPPSPGPHRPACSGQAILALDLPAHAEAWDTGGLVARQVGRQSPSQRPCNLSSAAGEAPGGRARLCETATARLGSGHSVTTQRAQVVASCGWWDNSVRCYSADEGRLLQAAAPAQGTWSPASPSARTALSSSLARPCCSVTPYCCTPNPTPHSQGPGAAPAARTAPSPSLARASVVPALAPAACTLIHSQGSGPTQGPGRARARPQRGRLCAGLRHAPSAVSRLLEGPGQRREQATCITLSADGSVLVSGAPLLQVSGRDPRTAHRQPETAALTLACALPSTRTPAEPPEPSRVSAGSRDTTPIVWEAVAAVSGTAVSRRLQWFHWQTPGLAPY